jgi:hypothetical protein
VLSSRQEQVRWPGFFPRALAHTGLRDSAEVQAHNVKKLVFYASTNPDKLELIGQYLVSKLNRRIRRGHDG